MNNIFVKSLLKSTKYSSVQGLRKISTLKETTASVHNGNYTDLDIFSREDIKINSFSVEI